MTKTPTGQLFRGESGPDLVLTRTFRAGTEDVWASITEPDRTARWFGPWEGEARPGSTIKVQMAYEEQTPWCDVRIDACDPPRRLAVSMTDEAGEWAMELLLTELEGSTELRLVQHLHSEAGLGEVGPGWEHYLDMLVAAENGLPRPHFDEYYPAMKAYYDELTVQPDEA